MLLDSNIIIAAAAPGGEKINDWLEGHALATSIICRIEVLGGPKLAEPQKGWLAAFFSKVHVLAMDATIAELAIRLRQERKLGLADAIIAATAMQHNLPLVTRNTDDFKRIAGLQLIDPLAL